MEIMIMIVMRDMISLCSQTAHLRHGLRKSSQFQFNISNLIGLVTLNLFILLELNITLKTVCHLFICESINIVILWCVHNRLIFVVVMSDFSITRPSPSHET